MSASEEYLFGPFRFVPSRHELRRDGIPVALRGRAAELLGVLLDADGGVVSRETIFDRLWPNVVVEPNNLTVTVAAVRKALGCGVAGARYVLTVSGQGYRFIAPIARPTGASREAATETDDAAGPTNLPARVSALIGRDEDLAHIADTLAETRLVTITGMGGVGKTSLAIAVGEAGRGQYADGIWLVELAPLESGELVAEKVAAIMGLPVHGTHSPADLVAAYLRKKKLLLILDNCEQVLAAVAELVASILRTCPEVRILATSREQLRVAGEQIYRLATLAVPAETEATSPDDMQHYGAIQLFVERARLAAGAFELTPADAGSVAEICRRLDGNALAIELAASRLAMVKPSELLSRLSDRFRILNRGDPTRPRHQTLEAVFDWSFDLLSPAEQALLRRLAIFGGSFTVDSAARIAGTEPLDRDDVFDVLGALVDKSLVAPVASAGEESRYRLLETTRAYGLRRLDPAEATACYERLARFLAEHYTEAEIRYRTTGTDPWLAAYAPDLDNVRAALQWAFGAGDPKLGVALVSPTWELWEELSLLRERRRWNDLALRHLDSETPPGIAGRIRVGTGAMASFGNRANLSDVLEALVLLRKAGDRYGTALALEVAASSSIAPGAVAEAEPYLREAEVLLRPLGMTKLLAGLLNTMGSVKLFSGDVAGARMLMQESLEVGRRLGFTRWILLIGCNLAELAFDPTHPETAIALAREVVEECRRVRALPALASTLGNLAGYRLVARDTEGARAAAREALELGVALSTSYRCTICIEHLARVAADLGAWQPAASLAGYTDAYYRSGSRARELVEAAGWDELSAMLREALPQADLDRLMADGAAWSEDEAATAALAL